MNEGDNTDKMHWLVEMQRQIPELVRHILSTEIEENCRV
jgi:hypothetical protein